MAGGIEERGGRRERAPPSAATRPDRSKKSCFLFRRSSLRSFAITSARNRKSRKSSRHGDTLASASSFAASEAPRQGFRSPEQTDFASQLAKNLGSQIFASVAGDADMDSRRTSRPVLPLSVGPGRFHPPTSVERFQTFGSQFLSSFTCSSSSSWSVSPSSPSLDPPPPPRF